MEQEQWVRWEPISGLAKKYTVTSLSENAHDGFVVALVDDYGRNKVRIIFSDSVHAYMSAEEGLRCLTYIDLNAKHEKGFYGEWTFFKVLNSSYVNWITEQSGGTVEASWFTHFSILASDSVVDIVTNYEPRVELITK